MKKHAFMISILVVIVLLYVPSVPFDRNQMNSSLKEQIVPDISLLTWTMEPDMHIGTFDEYLQSHPYSTSEFEIPSDQRCLSTVSLSSFSILVHQDIYPLIQSSLLQYEMNLEESGYSVFIETIQGGTPQEIKNWVQSRYQAGSCGVLFIGDIPAAWADVSDSIFPCDLYYMDLDGLWTDKNDDGIFEDHSSGSGDMGPELFVARLYTSTLTWDSEVSMINEYLAKVHSYRNGDLLVPWRGLEYIDEDWYTMDVFLDAIYFDNVSRYDYGHKTTAAGYLEKLSEGQHFVTVCAHSYPGGHHFSTHPTEAASYAHVYVFSPTNRQAMLLIGCDDGIKVWLNDEVVLIKDVHSTYRADQYRVNVNLSQGWNTLLCKISQEGGPYQFSARFTDTNLKTFSDLIYQLNDPDKGVYKDDSYIRSWLIHGFNQDIADNFWEYLTTNYLGTDEDNVVPHDHEEMNGHEWSVYNSTSPYIDLDTLSHQADFGVSYAFVKVIANEEISCQLRAGYDDGMCIWLNGERVLSDNRYGGYETDMTCVNVSLHAQENMLLVKLSEWMGSHGFSLRFCTQDGEDIPSLQYDPSAQPISYISSWLCNGVYENAIKDTRLSTDYLNGEVHIRPSEGDNSSDRLWVKGIGAGKPFDLGLFYDKGDWVYSETIQQLDPPVFFYNLFSCGPGRFTDEDYLAGSYIYHTSYGLISVASSKSGSMLNFQDFTAPLAQGNSFGVSFVKWFDAQAPYELWEKEWYYGMILQGDPLLTLFVDASSQPKISLIQPEKGIYFNDSRICPFFTPLIFGPCTIKAQVSNQGYGLKDVSFYIDGTLVHQTTEFPFGFIYDERRFGRVVIESIVTDIQDQQAIDRLVMWKFF